MAWDDDLPPASEADGPRRTVAVAPTRPRRRRVGLRHLMILIVGCAPVFLLARSFFESPSEAGAVYLALGAGALFLAVGGWALYDLGEVAILGWASIAVGYAILSVVIFRWFALVSIPILIGAVASIVARKRAIDQDALLGVMAIAAGRRMPLAPAIAAHAEQVTGPARLWARSLAQALDYGSTPADAIDSLPRAVPRPAAVLIRVGSDVDALGPALRTAVSLRAAQLPVIRSVGGRITYLAGLFILGQGVVSFLIYFILPKIEAIFADFGTELPWPTQILASASYQAGEYSLLVVLAEFLAVAYLVLEFGGHGLGIGSPIARLSRRRHSALILRSLALAVDAGRSLTPTLATLAEYYPSRSIRRRLIAATRDQAEGEPWAEALRDRGLLTRAEAGVLEAAGRAGNLGWALREMASTGERRWAYRIQAWSQVAFFLALLGAGGVVLLIALAYFLPLVYLISRMGG